MAEAKIDEKIKTKILEAARRGESFAAIGRRYSLSRERVRQLVRKQDPAFPSRVQEPKPPPPRPRCMIDEKEVPAGRVRYCSDRCAEVGNILRKLGVYRHEHLKVQAKYTLRTSDDKVQRRWARRVLQGEAGQKRWLMTNSRAYRLLKKAGVLDQLPEHVKIIEPRGKQAS